MDVPDARTKKKASRKSPRKRVQRTNDDDANGNGSDDDVESVTSVASTVDSIFPIDEDADNGLEHQDDWEAKLLDNIENSSHKSARIRQVALSEVHKAFCRKYMCNFVMDRKDSLLDMVEKLLKRGQPEDRVLGCGIASVFGIQIGEGEALALFTTLKSVLITIMSDETLAPVARAGAASALGMCCFIGAEEQTDTQDCLNALKAVYSKKVPADAAHHVTFASAVSAWGLLLTVSSEPIVMEQVQGCIAAICKLLEVGDLNLRIAAGETVALVYELSRQFHITLGGHVNVLYGLLRELANESGHHKGKKEKRQQKASFKDIFRAVETKSGFVPDSVVQFGTESLNLHSWSRIRRYNSFKEVLRSGVNVHLQNNPLLRDIFDLGLPIADVAKESKDAKYERQLMNQACAKDRNQRRNRRRDNKQAAAAI